MQIWNLLHAARWKHRTQKKSPKIAIWPPSHNFVGLYLRNERTYRQSEKLVKQQYALHMSPQYGELRPTSGWDRFTILGTPPNFNGLRVLAALLHSSKVVGVSQTLRRWTEGATYVRQGDHHVAFIPGLAPIPVSQILPTVDSPSSGLTPRAFTRTVPYRRILFLALSFFYCFGSVR